MLNLTVPSSLTTPSIRIFRSNNSADSGWIEKLNASFATTANELRETRYIFICYLYSIYGNCYAAFAKCRCILGSCPFWVVYPDNPSVTIIVIIRWIAVIAAAVITAAVVATAVVATAIITAAIVTAAIVTAAIVTATIVTATIVTAVITAAVITAAVIYRRRCCHRRCCRRRCYRRRCYRRRCYYRRRYYHRYYCYYCRYYFLSVR